MTRMPATVSLITIFSICPSGPRIDKCPKLFSSPQYRHLVALVHRLAGAESWHIFVQRLADDLYIGRLTWAALAVIEVLEFRFGSSAASFQSMPQCEVRA